MSDLACAFCGTPSVPGARYCHYCGAPLEHPGLETETERRLVTVLFGDLSDFTGWAEDLDPERVGVVTDRVLAALSRAVADSGGHVDKLTGDGIMALFGAPVAHGDDAERAVRAALRMQRDVRRLVADEAGGGRRLGLRVGLNTGEVLAGIQAALSYTVVGDTVNTASRLADAAGIGSVIAGRDTMLATAHVASWRELPPLRLKGKREPVVAFELVSLRPVPVGRVALGHEAPLVGRDDELGELVARFMAVADHAEPATLVVTGEAGVGKTRLVRELARFAGELPGGRVLWGRCTPYGEGRDLAPLHDWVVTAAGAGDDAGSLPADELAERVRRLVQRLDPGGGWGASAPIADGLLTLLGLGAAPGAPLAPAPGAEADDPALGAVVALLTALAQAPLLLVVDDAQGASAALRRALARVAGALTGRAMLVVIDRGDGTSAGGLAAELHLRPLPPAATDQLLVAYLGGELAPGSRAALVERAQGNPYFLAELVALLLDRGRLTRSGKEWQLDLTGVATALPAGVRAVIAARVDELDQGARALLRDAAVIGVRVNLSAFAALGYDPDEVDRAVDVLVERGLLDAPAEGSTQFRHGLVRDVAYAGLPKAERARRHAAVAAWAAAHREGPPADVDAFVAAQAERAVLLAREMSLPQQEVAATAAPLGLAAYGRRGTHAAERGELDQAADLLGRALALVPDPPPPTLLSDVRRLRVARASALARTGRLAEAGRELGDAAGSTDPRVAAGALVVLGTIRHAQQDDERAVEAFVAALRLAGEAGDDRVAGEALRSLGLLDYAAGRLAAAERRYEEALTLAENSGDQRAGAWALQHLTWSATTRGDFGTGEQRLRRASELFAALDDRAGLAWCAATEGYQRMLQGRFRAARASTAPVITGADPVTDRWAHAVALTVDAIAAAELGAVADAAAQAREGRAGFRAAGDTWGEMLAVVAEGIAARSAGDLDLAVTTVREALDLARQARYPVLELVAATTLGYCQLDRGDLDGAEAAARHAIEVIRALELQRHAYVGPRVLLAQVVRRRGRLDEALDLLSAVAATAAEGSLLFPRRQALAHYAGALLEAGRVDEAAAVVHQAFSVPAEDVRSQVIALRVRAAVLRAQGDPVAAHLALRDALSLATSTQSKTEAEATLRVLADLTAL